MQDVTIHRLRNIMASTGMGYAQIAPLAGVSVSTVRHVLATGEMPSRQHPRDALERFVAKNVNATKREQLRLV